jgi:UDP-xylose/UDP-N-acetylglucosamine transporter B4
MIITVGIVLATISAPRRRSPPRATPEVTIQSTDLLSDNLQYASGILMLAMALFLSSCLGIFQEETYRLHGKKWREGLFYCVCSIIIFHLEGVADRQHFLSLPFFVPFYSSLMSTFEAFSLSTPVNLLAIPTPAMLPETRFLSLVAGESGLKDSLIQWRQLMIPSAIGALLLNVITQGMCVRGVNRLITVSPAMKSILGDKLTRIEGQFNDCESGFDDT